MTRLWIRAGLSEEMTSIDTMLRDVVVTLKEEQACLELWFKDKAVKDDVCRGIEISLKKISVALGKLAALERDDHGKTDSPVNLSEEKQALRK
jgi:hypothetical protein